MATKETKSGATGLLRNAFFYWQGYSAFVLVEMIPENDQKYGDKAWFIVIEYDYNQISSIMD